MVYGVVVVFGWDFSGIDVEGVGGFGDFFFGVGDVGDVWNLWYIVV